MSDDLKERLREVGGISDDGATRWYINPDGPEAADRIKALEAANLKQSLITVDHLSRIEALEAALREIASTSKVIAKGEDMALALTLLLTSHRKLATAALAGEKKDD